MAIKELDFIVGPRIERPSQRERLSTYVNFYLPDGQKVRLTNTEFKVARALREDSAVSRRNWALRTSEDSITPQWAYDRVGKFRPALNKKFDSVDWEVQEILPTGYIPGRSKEAAQYRLNFKRKPPGRVAYIPGAQNPDRGRLVYPSSIVDVLDEGVETRLIHSPYPMEEIGGIRYLTEGGWQIMNTLVPTLDQETSIPIAELPNVDRRELDYLIETLAIYGIEVVNEYSTDKQGYSHDSRINLRRVIIPTEGDNIVPQVEVTEAHEELDESLFTPIFDDHDSEEASSERKTMNGRQPKIFRYTLDFEPLTLDQRKRISAVPFIPQERLESLRSFLSRDRLEGWFNRTPDSLDSAEDLHLFPEDVIKLLTFLNAFSAGRVENYDYRDPVTSVDFKGAIRNAFEEYLNRYPERELTDVFQAVVITLHQPLLPRQIYTRAGVQDLDFRDLWQEQGENFTREWVAHYSNVFGFCQFKVGNPEVAANLAQDVFETAWRKRNTYDPRMPFNHYLIKVASNKVVDHFRRLRESVPLEVVEMGVPVEPLYQPKPKLDLEMERQHDIAVVRKVVAAQPSEDRELLRLRYWERQRFDAIASALGKKTPTVRQLHARLLGRLKENIEDIWRQENQPGSEKIVWALDPDDF